MRIGMGLGITQCGGGVPWFWEADLEPLPLSTSSNSAALVTALAAKGLVLTRASSATVQTSATTVVTSGIGVDAPRVGNAGYGQGLVLEGARTSYARSSEDMSSAYWGTPASITANTGTAPNGTATADRYTPIGLSSHSLSQGYFTVGTSTYTASVWLKQNNVRSLNYHTYVNPPGTFTLVEGAYQGGLPTGEWVRKIYTSTASVAPGVAMNHYINYELANGYTGNVEVWGYDAQAGNFPTEYIPTTTADVTRAADQLVYTGDLVSSGRIGIEFQFIPKMSSAEALGSTLVLWQASTAPFDYVGIGTGGNAMAIRNSVAAYSSGVTLMTWNRHDVVNLFVEAGGGALASRAWYRKNGGAAIALDTGAVIATNMQTSPSCSLFTGGITSCWAQGVRAYRPGIRPAWCV
jgi:hypothetical protein